MRILAGLIALLWATSVLGITILPIKNPKEDGDIVIQVNDGGVIKNVMTFDGATGNALLLSGQSFGVDELTDSAGTGAPNASNGLGIGTDTLTSQFLLDIQGTTARGRLEATGSDNAVLQLINPAGTLGLSAQNSTDEAYIQYDGTVLKLESGSFQVGEGAPGTNEVEIYGSNASYSTAYRADSTLVVERSGNNFIEIVNSAANTGGILFSAEGKPQYGQIRYDPNNDMQFYVNNAEKMRLDSSGYLGVNGTNTDGIVTVNAASGTSFVRRMITMNHDEGTWDIGLDNGHIWFTNPSGSQVALIKNDGELFGASVNVGDGKVSNLYSGYQNSPSWNYSTLNSHSITDNGAYQWHRIGNIVSLWGKVRVTSGASNTQYVELANKPVASDLTSVADDCLGVVQLEGASNTSVYCVTGTDRIRLEYYKPGGGTNWVGFSISYIVK